ncbi:MAG: chromosomal replication initiator protein DnaA [Phycisphaerae bacterium]|nr:chromosomal replication initiator protein DnaA [Phycisphaerae bacterium]
MPTVDRELWQKIIQQVVISGGHIIRPWFTELQPLALDNGLLEIQVPGPGEKDYCQKHATKLFTDAAQGATGRLVGICFLTDASEANDIDEPDGGDATWRSDRISGLGKMSAAFQDDYVFKTFVTGPCNRLAHAASLAISELPGTVYNPLFLHGSSGLGKTHLLHAICQKVVADKPLAQIAVLSCETFVNHFIEAVEKGQLQKFRYLYRHLDVLAVDDIQFLANHEQTQEEFFHTFNTLYQDHKQIIISGDRSPDAMASLEERLISRFQWGLVTRIDRPCYETRLAIIHKKARFRNIRLPDDVACFIAGSIDSNTRELEGAIAKVTMLSQVTGRAVDLPLAQEALGSSMEPKKREVTIEDILSAVTLRYSVRLADLQSKKRSRSIAFPRQICMYLARNLTRHSLEEIGGYFGGRDHTTVLHANRTIEALCSNDPHLQGTLERLSQDIQATD